MTVFLFIFIVKDSKITAFSQVQKMEGRENLNTNSKDNQILKLESNFTLLP